MPDITMCRSTECPRAQECYRFRARPNPHRQSMASFYGQDVGGECDWFLKLEEGDDLAGMACGGVRGDGDDGSNCDGEDER